MHKRAQERFDDQAADIVGLVLGGLCVMFALGLVAFVLTY